VSLAWLSGTLCQKTYGMPNL